MGVLRINDWTDNDALAFLKWLKPGCVYSLLTVEIYRPDYYSDSGRSAQTWFLDQALVTVVDCLWHPELVVIVEFLAGS